MRTGILGAVVVLITLGFESLPASRAQETPATAPATQPRRATSKAIRATRPVGLPGRPSAKITKLTDDEMTVLIYPVPTETQGGEPTERAYTIDKDTQVLISRVMNVHTNANGQKVTMNQVIGLLRMLGAPVRVVRAPGQKGDARRTAADIALARGAFGFRPATGLRDGLAAMVAAARAGRPLPVG